jgi:hypothetical protein
MEQADAAHTGLTQAIDRFPNQAALLRRMVLKDHAFRSLCEDYALARASLAAFEARPDAAERPEITDYRAVITELEGEIARFLTATGQGW